MNDFDLYENVISVAFADGTFKTFSARQVYVAQDKPTLVQYVEPTPPKTKTTARPTDLAAFIATKPRDVRIELQRGSVHVVTGWEPGSNSIVTWYGDPALPKPIVQLRYDGKETTSVALRNDDTTIDGIRVEKHPAAKGRCNGFTIARGHRLVVRNCEVGPGMFRGLICGENYPCADVWVLDNTFDFADDYGWYTGGGNGGTTRAYFMRNKVAGVKPGGSNHTFRAYGLQDCLFQENEFGPSGVWEKSLMNIRQVRNTDLFKNTFTGLSVKGSGAGVGPNAAANETGEVVDVRLTENVFKNLNSFNLYSGTENLSIIGGEQHYLNFGMTVVKPPLGKLPASGKIIGLKVYGKQFITGDTSRLAWKGNWNQLNDKPV